MRTLILFWTLFPVLAIAGSQLEYSADSGTASYTIQTDDNNLKVDYFKNNKAEHSILFSGSKQEVKMINHQEKMYHVMNKAMARQMAGKVNTAMAQMQAALKQMPPEMQKMMKQKMAQNPMFGGGKLPKTELKKIKANVPVGSYKTTQYKILSDKRPVSELWIASFGEVGVSQNSFKVMQSLGKFFNDIAGEFKQGGSLKQMGFQEWSKFQGVPVKTVNLRKGDEVYTLKKAYSKKFASKDFQVPGSYKEARIMQ